MSDSIIVIDDSNTAATANATDQLNSTQIIGADEFNISYDVDAKKEEADFGIDVDDAYFAVSSGYLKELRVIKKELEEFIFRKIKNLEFDRTVKETPKYIHYFKNFSIDKVGSQVIQGETGIAEGWSVPKYSNEFQNMLGLPFTEDNSLGETLRIKRPHQECFNCLALSHRVTDCPIKIDDERIRLHRSLFTAQSQQALDQAHLFSTRYTADQDEHGNGKFKPGKISDELRSALGIRHHQLPPFVYRMREVGYPVGWLIEAQVNKSKLAMHDDHANGNAATATAAKPDSNEPNSVNTSTNQGAAAENEPVEYDPEKIFSFAGFNEPPPKGTVDESEKYGVRRYGHDLSKERFLSTLNLAKRKIVRRPTTKTKSGEKSEQKTTTGGGEENSNDDGFTEVPTQKTPAKKKPSKEGGGSTECSPGEIVSDQENEPGAEEEDEEGESLGSSSPDSDLSMNSENDDDSDNGSASKKKKRWQSEREREHGTSLVEIPGTPILRNVTSVDRVPASGNFSANICEHKPYEMDAATPNSGSYQRIVNLTRKLKPGSGNDNSHHSNS